MAFIGCNTKKKPITLKPFNPICSDVSFFVLQDKGFERLPVDVPFLEYLNGDTLINIQYDYKDSIMEPTKPVSQHWTIPLKTLDSLIFVKFLKQKRLTIETPIDFNNPLNKSFCVRNYWNRKLFLCKITEGNENFNLEVTYHFPTD